MNVFTNYMLLRSGVKYLSKSCPVVPSMTVERNLITSCPIQSPIGLEQLWVEAGECMLALSAAEFTKELRLGVKNLQSFCVQ